MRPMTSKEDAVRAAGKVMDTVFEKGVDEELGALEGEELLAEDVRTIRVHAQGETLVDASNDLFKALRNKVFSEIEAPIVQMTAESVVFDRVVNNEFTEHFLGVFMPRERTRYDVTASIKVNVKYLKFERGEV